MLLFSNDALHLTHHFSVMCDSNVYMESRNNTCADPERFTRAGPTLTCFFGFLADEGIEDQNTTKTGYHRPASETMMSRH